LLTGKTAEFATDTALIKAFVYEKVKNILVIFKWRM
jgi:hypothetical protein